MNKPLTLNPFQKNSLSVFFRKTAYYINLEAWITYLLVALMPFSVFWPVGRPFSWEIIPLYVTPGFYISDLAMVMVIGLWFLCRKDESWGPIEFWGALGGFTLLALLTTPWALEPKLSAYITLRWLIAFGVYLWFVRCKVPTQNIVLMFVIVMSIQAAIGLTQVLHSAPGLPGELIREGSRPGAAFGLTFNPNVLGGYLAAGILLCIPLLHRWFMWILWLTMWAGLLVTVSRAAFLGTIFAGLLVIVWVLHHYKRQRWLLLAGLVVIIFTLGLGDRILNHRMSNGVVHIRKQLNDTMAWITTEDQSDVSADNEPTTQWQDYALSILGGIGKGRLMMVELALAVMQQKPLTGVGAGNFPLVMQSNQHLMGSMPPMYVHNVAFLLASEVGVLGGGFWLLLCFSGLYFLLRYWNTGNIWLVAILSAWLAIAVISWFDSYPWALNSGRLLTVMVLGLAARQLTDAELQTKNYMNRDQPRSSS